jgi:hypothetical protein
VNAGSFFRSDDDIIANVSYVRLYVRAIFTIGDLGKGDVTLTQCYVGKCKSFAFCNFHLLKKTNSFLLGRMNVWS